MPSSPLYNAPSTPQSAEFLAQAKRHNKITTAGMPAQWGFDNQGRLIDRATGRPVALGRFYSDGTEKPQDSFLKQLGHATPYIGAAIGMGAFAAPAAASAPGYMGAMYAAPTAAATTAPVVAATTGTTAAASAGLGTYALRYGLGVGGDLLGSYLQARASGKASDAQLAYYREALAYEKERDAYDRKVDEERYAYDRDLEAGRYGDLRARLAPYVATGTSANDRMAALLGLPVPGRG